MLFFDPEYHIDLTNTNLVALVKKAYELSAPQGLGFFHAKPGGLTDDEAKNLISDTGRYAVSMDYINGRSVKLRVSRDKDGRLYMSKSWYDHSDRQMKELLDSSKAAA